MKTECWFIKVKTEDKKWYIYAAVPVYNKTSKEAKKEIKEIFKAEKKKYPQYKFKITHEFYK